MPEGPEVTILSHYLNDKLQTKIIENICVLSGKYTNKEIPNLKLFNDTIKHKICNVKSKGKVMYITAKNLSTNKKIYFVSHLGMAGEWSFNKTQTDRIRITVKSNKTNKTHTLCYKDPRNFGNIEILNTEENLKNRLDKLAPDVLKTNFSNNDFYEMVLLFLKKSKKRKDQLIFKVLMKQNLSDGLISGLGNYLVPEILYKAKISPYRTIESLSKNDILNISKSIKHVVKLSYYNNTTGYMKNFGEYITIHKNGIDDGKYDNYHPDVKFKKTHYFEFKIYQKNKDPVGNTVIKDKDLNKDRTTHWVSEIQK